MSAVDNEQGLKESVQEILGAKEQLRALAEQVKSYPEAAERLGAVCAALDRVTRGLGAATEAMSAQDALVRQAVNRLNETSHRMEANAAEILGAIKVLAVSLDNQKDASHRMEANGVTVLGMIEALAVSLDNQKILVEKAANKRGFSF